MSLLVVLFDPVYYDTPIAPRARSGNREKGHSANRITRIKLMMVVVVAVAVAVAVAAVAAAVASFAS